MHGKFRLIDSDECVFSVVNNKTQILLGYLSMESKLVGLFTLQSRWQNPNSSLVLPRFYPFSSYRNQSRGETLD